MLIYCRLLRESKAVISDFSILLLQFLSYFSSDNMQLLKERWLDWSYDVNVLHYIWAPEKSARPFTTMSECLPFDLWPKTLTGKLKLGIFFPAVISSHTESMYSFSSCLIEQLRGCSLCSGEHYRMSDWRQIGSRPREESNYGRFCRSRGSIRMTFH